MTETTSSKSNSVKSIAGEIPSVDIVITMGCNVKCPHLPCTHREDWGLEDPSGKSDEIFRQTRDVIKEKMEDLVKRIRRNEL